MTISWLFLFVALWGACGVSKLDHAADLRVPRSVVAQGEIPSVPLAGRRRLIARLTLEQLLAGEQPRH